MVENITLRTTQVRTWDGRDVLIPNGDVYIKPIVNFSRDPKRRIKITAQIPADIDLQTTSDLMLASLEQVSGAASKPSPEVVWIGADAGTVTLYLYLWVHTRQAQMRAAQDEALQRIREHFQSEGLAAPTLKTEALEGE